MELDQLEAFLSVATLGGFTRASQELHRSQPAISRRVAALEAALDARLFERRGRAVAITAEGRALLPHAQAALAAIRDGERALAELRSGAAQEPLSVAVVGTLADRALTETLRAFRRAHPDTGVSLRTATSREVSALVRGGEAEIGIRYFPDAHPDLEGTELGSERVFLMVEKSHRLPSGRVVPARELANESWLGFPTDPANPDSFGHLLERELLGLGLAEPHVTRVDSLTAQKRLVEAGLGIALLPRSACSEELGRGTLREVRVRGMKPAQPVVAIRRRRGLRRACGEDFLSLLTKRFRRRPS